MGGCARAVRAGAAQGEWVGAEMRGDWEARSGLLCGCVAAATPEDREDKDEIVLGFVASGGIHIWADCLRQ